MKKDRVVINGIEIDVYSCNTAVVGTGAAGFNAADSLYNLGQRDVLIVTEGLNMGTSRNTGSDKQTYYKLTLAGEGHDSVAEMAKTLYQGGSMHGDIALVEAAMSARCFYKLVDVGVPFPHDRHGQYIGYKTDHDPRQRATSCGPLTSKMMTEMLEKQIVQKGIEMLDGYRVIGILTDKTEKDGETKAIGLAVLNLKELDKPNMGFALINCTNIVYATGGPAGIYHTSVYPKSQTGASGAAFEAGAKGINLTEWQYGIASVKFRWNLSGTYQQVIPRYVSTNMDGTDEKEFLDEYFENPGKMLEDIFLKGYQWPFDPRKILGSASSIIDILVYNETQLKGRRVFMDFMSNPTCAIKNGEMDFSLLGAEAQEYLKKSGALFGNPLERLAKMNTPAIKLYMEHGIDLSKEYLEIAVCAQHNNGGLMGNIWWESNIRHLFPVGEVNGTFGIYRPGGTALNSTQVGSLRAAQYISSNYKKEPSAPQEFSKAAAKQVLEKLQIAKELVAGIGSSSNVIEQREKLQKRMTGNAAHIRSLDGIKKCIAEGKAELAGFINDTKLSSICELGEAFINRDLLLTQLVYLNAMKEYIEKGGRSRGSYLIADAAGELPNSKLSQDFRFSLDNGDLTKYVSEVELKKDGETLECLTEWKPVRDIPNEDGWFENVWNAYLRGEVIK